MAALLIERHQIIFKALAEGKFDSVVPETLIKLEDMLAEYMERKGLVPDDDPFCHPACDHVTELLRTKAAKYL